MAEWLIEEGIGEDRALLVERGEVLAARLRWPGELTVGAAYEAVLISKPGGSRRGVVMLKIGVEALVDHLPAHVNEGASGYVRIARASIAEKGRLKLAQSRWIDLDDEPNPRHANSQLSAFGLPSSARSRVVSAFEAGQWEEVWYTGAEGTLAFAGGNILLSATPAMTLIDVDGQDSSSRTAFASVSAIARAIRWLELGGSIGIDFPTLPARADRKHVNDLLSVALEDWPHEATAMNGFGFVQLVSRLSYPSLLHRFSTSRVGLCARMALRVAERAQGTGGVLALSVHPALKPKLRPEWIEELAHRTGRQVRIETDRSLALEAPNAQILSE